MNPLVLACVQGAVGFAIGAGTNDLAIRWIFTTVFGKKKREIATAVQRVVSEELMTPDKIARRLQDPATSNAIRMAFEEAIDKMCAKDPEAFTEMVRRDLDIVARGVMGERGRDSTLPLVAAGWVAAMAQTIRAIPLGDVGKEMFAGLRKTLASLCAAECTAFARDRMAELVRETHIWDVIYESIVSYDEKKMEVITRSVANRELRGVTIWGGVIGFMVGFFGSLLIHFLQL